MPHKTSLRLCFGGGREDKSGCRQNLYSITTTGSMSADQSSPPEVVVGHVQVFQCEQEVIKGLSRNFDQLVVVDDQVLQVDQSRQVSGAECCQSIT